jgi:tetratricopeptide (TPR) repeat protein
MQTKPPVALFIFSNDTDDYLPQIEEEKKQIQRTLEVYYESSRMIVIMESYTTKAELMRLFQRYEGRIVLFHFSGHTGSQGLQLNKNIINTDTAYADGVTGLIAKEAKAQLKFVFLNGCSTIRQADALKKVGVSSIITTNFPISDNEAFHFAVSFYKTLANVAKIDRLKAKPTTMAQAFEAAKNYLRLSYETPQITEINTDKRRGFIFESDNKEQQEAWELSTTEPNWHLPNIESKGEYPKKLGSKPFNADVFLGRTTELETIHNRLFKQESLLLLVNGEGGIGKTTLAAKYYQRYEDIYEHLIWVYAERGVVEAILTLEIPLKLGLDPKLDQNQRFEAILEELHELDKPSLLVIDNANDVSDLEEHYIKLKQFTNLHILLTSRVNELGEAPIYKIKPLPKNTAIALFKEHYPRYDSKDDTLLLSILEAVGYNTLVIELLAKNLRNLNKLKTNYHLTDLLSDLQNRGLLTLSKSKAVKTPYHAKDKLQHAKPEVIIAAMYDINELDAEEQKILVNFSVLPAENIPFEYLDILLTDFEDLETTLLLVAQKGWLDFDEKGSNFKISPVVQEVINQKIHTQLQNCTGILSKLIERIKYDGRSIEGANSKDIIFFIKYSEAIIQNINQPNYELAILHEHLGSFYSIKGDLIKAHYFFNNSEISFSKLLELEPNNLKFKEGKAILISTLGENYKNLGKNDKALDAFKEGRILFIELYNSDIENKYRHYNNEALCYQFMGMISLYYGNRNDTLKYFRHFNEIEKELNKMNPQNARFKHLLAISYRKLAEVYITEGKLNTPLDYLNLDAKLCKEICDDFPSSKNYKTHLAISYEKVGDVQMKLGNKQEAIKNYSEENKLFKELIKESPENGDYKNSLAISYSKLGNYHFSLKDFDDTIQYFQKYYDLKRELYAKFPKNIKFKNGFALAFGELGKVYLIKGELDKAIQNFVSCSNLILELYGQDNNNVDYKRNLSDTYCYLGRSYKSLNLERSLHYFEISFKLITELFKKNPTNIDYKNLLAKINLEYGKYYQYSKDLKNAKLYFEAAKALWKQLVNQTPDYVQYQRNLDSITEELSNL